MIIKCPKCSARAKLPDSKEGAKVKCGECGRIYVASASGARNTHSSGQKTGLYVAMGIGAALLFGLLFVLSQGEEEPVKAKAPVVAEEPSEPYVDELSWDGAVMRAARGFHEAVFLKDRTRIEAMIEPAQAWAWDIARTAAEEATAAATAAALEAKERVPLPVEPELGSPAGYGALSKEEQDALLDGWVTDLIDGEGHEVIGTWEPYDGEILEAFEGEVTLRFAVAPRDSSQGAAKRYVQWKLTREPGASWKAYAWDRWISPEERARMKKKRSSGYEKVTLTDGSLVFEREPEPLPHLADTHADIAARIDQLYPIMIDLDLTTEANDARAGIVEIGRASIPILLTGLYETPLDSEENAIKANMIVQALREITAQDFGYKPQVLVGSGTGTTEERRQSAIKQWFAWWYRNEDRFEKAEEVDGLEGLIELTEKEKAWLERHKD